MTKKPNQLYCRLILLLVIGYVVLQCCSFYLMDIANMKPRDDSVNRNITKYLNIIYPFMMDVNTAQMISNERKFSPLENSSAIIVIQVHKATSYLPRLIESLSHANGISDVLLIFSYDFFDEQTYDSVLAIEFCKVMQIFYPHSIQLYPHSFPGTDPNDCPRKMSKLKALIMNCNNALSPDLHGNYRDARYTEKKHHWWWKANYVFHKLEVTKNFTGLVLFLEEDDIVAEDFLFVLYKMQKFAKKLCSHCNIFSLGSDLGSLKPNSTRDDNAYSKVQYAAWSSEQHAVAVAFNASTWSEIHTCAQEFCAYDDYNWDKSLDYIGETCIRGGLNVLTVKKSRVYSTRNSSYLNMFKANLEFSSASKLGQLYPTTLKLSRSILKAATKQPIEVIKSGEWSDPRDHRLCLNAAYA
ncbi:uncharacterized protein Dmoj_GI18065 [Drosophila mojavensis]|uniref:Alpha-1,6-mannosyl-glycoprotein 2-beta-N-acetylglucosaminyltransferase n=1 Tax=Drosophila mojavensis TaxID=7230 RepID=B4KG18_DROMO|nr:uncharacterized protein Dmoj_GI18065 [Drosophila mojavensis]